MRKKKRIIILEDINVQEIINPNDFTKVQEQIQEIMKEKNIFDSFILFLLFIQLINFSIYIILNDIKQYKIY